MRNVQDIIICSNIEWKQDCMYWRKHKINIVTGAWTGHKRFVLVIIN